jgi:hypothetical protein
VSASQPAPEEAPVAAYPRRAASWVPSVELVEELTGEPPVRDPKTSAATLAAEVAALWTVPAALAAVVPRLDGRRNAPPTEAGTVCTGAEGVKPAAGLASAGVGRRPPSPRGAAGEAAGSGRRRPVSGRKAAGSGRRPRALDESSESGGRRYHVLGSSRRTGYRKYWIGGGPGRVPVIGCSRGRRGGCGVDDVG